MEYHQQVAAARRKPFLRTSRNSLARSYRIANVEKLAH